MSEKRRDSKNRILNRGESQRKDGCYQYKYIDHATGKPKFLYSWKLVETDRLPAGKRSQKALRTMITELNRDIMDGIDPTGRKMTVCQLYQKQNDLRANVRRNTKTGRKYLMDILENDRFGSMPIEKVKPSDAKEFLIRLYQERGTTYNVVNNYKRSLKAAFMMAIDDDYIRKNPFNFKLTDIIPDDRKPKEALTAAQTGNLLRFIQQDEVYRKHYSAVYILLHTGLRISELCGLTVYDIDMEDHSINIDHQLLRDSDGYYISPPKTDSGNRQIPMDEGVYERFRDILASERKLEAVIDGHKGFLFVKPSGLPMTSGDYNAAIVGMVKKYNKFHEEQLPHITPHLLRHTFCTNMANEGMNPKALQYIMGHTNITMTLDYYAHATFESVKAEMKRLAA